jgi:predicted transcriptional regulator
VYELKKIVTNERKLVRFVRSYLNIEELDILIRRLSNINNQRKAVRQQELEEQEALASFVQHVTAELEESKIHPHEFIQYLKKNST